ncbi:MAG: Ldh family oxidoreductase, partial [Desulfocucumaceae bacterium]
AGMPPGDATILADCLVEADLRGHGTHGAARLGMYLERVKKGVMKASPDIKVIRDSGAVTELDGDSGYGQVVAARALDIASDRAGEAGVGVVAVRNSGHVGALGVLAERVVSGRKIGMIFTNTSPIMAPWGGKEPELGNNPFAIAVPREKGDPVIVDMALSITARGNIILASRENRPIPEGWAIDRNGRPVTDAREALLGTVLPLAGHKGYALAMVIEILAGVLTGASFGRNVASLVPPDLSKPLGMGHLVIVLDVEKFMPWDEFQQRLEQFLQQIKSSPEGEMGISILIPGQRSAEKRSRRTGEGYVINPSTYEELMGISKEYGVPLEIPAR